MNPERVVTVAYQYHDPPAFAAGAGTPVGRFANLLLILICFPYFHNSGGLQNDVSICKWEHDMTDAGHPITTATTANIVSPFPYPSVVYICCPKSGNANPQSERRKATAASANPAQRYISNQLM